MPANQITAMNDKAEPAAMSRQLIVYCLRKKGAYEDYPFGPEPLTIKVKGKIFAVFYNAGTDEKLTLKCVPDFGDFMKQMYPGVVMRGYHFPPVSQPYFITVDLRGSIPQHELLMMIDHAYNAVVAKLPKKLQNELKNEKPV